MLAVVIQPYNYRKMSKISDVKEIAVIKFSRKAMFEQDYSFTTLYTGQLDEKAIKIIFDNVNDENVITYSGSMLLKMMTVIKHYYPEYDFEDSKIVGLMEAYADKYPTSKRFHKLVEALSNYGYNVELDRDDPFDMVKNTLVLYRFMTANNDL